MGLETLKLSGMIFLIGIMANALTGVFMRAGCGDSRSPMAAPLYVCRGVCPTELGVTMGDLIRGVFPFVGLIMVGLVLCAIFPQIIIWLPYLVIK